jgi:hypothetical protein
MRQNSKFLIAAISATNASQLTASIDTRGFSFARISLFQAGGTTAINTTPTNNTIAENDDNSTNWSVISASAAGTAFTVNTATSSTALAKIVFDVDLRGRKRYLRPLFTPGATQELFITADLSEPADGCATAAEVGTANYGAL